MTFCNNYFNVMLVFAENLPDAGKAQDFMKKFNQVLSEDEKLRIQLEMLISPTCSCKQAEICVVREHEAYLNLHTINTTHSCLRQLV